MDLGISSGGPSRVSASGNGVVPVSADGSGRFVLVADDDPDVLELICIRLELAGYQTLRASDGERALALALDHLPCACILDVVLPKLGGLDVLGELRRNGATANTPVMILSAAARHTDIELGLECGANAYMTKPFSPSELLRRLAALIDHPALPSDVST